MSIIENAIEYDVFGVHIQNIRIVLLTKTER